MSNSVQRLVSGAADYSLAAVHRFKGTWFNLVQTSVAAGLSWYIADDLLAHPQPFFAPIASAVCLSITNVLRAVRAVQMIIGVSLGIWIGALIQKLIGGGVVPIAVVVLIALSVAVLIGQGFIGQGMMFANQTVVSSILVLALFRNGAVTERIDDALIGGGVAIVFAVLLFPANPLTLLRNGRTAVLECLHRVLSSTADAAAGREAAAAQGPLQAVDEVHEQLGRLLESRTTARQAVRLSPRRWHLRGAVQDADHQAVHVALLAGSVLQLTRVVMPAVDGCCRRLAQPVEPVLLDLAKATELAETDPAAATTHVEAARRQAATLLSNARERTEVVVADVVQGCVNDLQKVIDLRQP